MITILSILNKTYLPKLPKMLCKSLNWIFCEAGEPGSSLIDLASASPADGFDADLVKKLYKYFTKLKLIF